MSSLTPFRKVVSIIGCGTALGQPRKGVEHGPAALRDYGVVSQIKAMGWEVIDQGDLDVNVLLENDTPINADGARNPRSSGAANKLIHDAVRDARMRGEFALQLGGDHSLAIGSIAGVLAADPDACVIWVDAHGDINTPKSSPSKNIHGMPIAFLCGMGNVAEQPGFDWLKFGCLARDRICFIGLRDIDTIEKEIMRTCGVHYYSMYEVDKMGIGAVMAEALKKINPDGTRNIHLSFDIDGLDPTIAPSTGTRCEGGLTLREGRYICEALWETGKLRSMDMVEVNPSIHPEGASHTVSVACMMIKHAMGLTLV